MEPLTQWYFLLVLCGLLLLGIEVYMPGAILGIFGGVCLIAAIVIGFIQFEAPWNIISAIAILFLSIGIIIAFMKFLPNSKIFNKLALTNDMSESKGTDDFTDLTGQEGVAVTPMRPSGIITIDGKRVDVVAEGSWIDSGTNVKVIRVEGNQITVRAIT
jgi:membrane-bound serine protease (ClpP class)